MAPAPASDRSNQQGGGTRLNLSNNQSLALCWEASREEAPHGAQAVATPVPCGFSASLADSPASGGRGRTTADGRAQSVAAGPAPAGTARSAPAAPAHPHAAADPDPARDGSHHCEPGVAAGTVHFWDAKSLWPGRLVGGGAAAGQYSCHHQTAGRAARGGVMAAPCCGLLSP